MVAPASTPVMRQFAAAKNEHPDALLFSVQPDPLPDNAALNATTGIFTFEPTPAQIGEFVFTFIVGDGVASDSETITVSVSGSEPGAPTALQGLVLDAADAAAGTTTPIEGATVRSLDTGVSTTTGADGTFLLTDLTPGAHESEFPSSCPASTRRVRRWWSPARPRCWRTRTSASP